jgi:hypothetical protein
MNAEKILMITEVEIANNYWRDRQASGADCALCPSARVLADVYGKMIYTRIHTVSAKELNARQAEAMEIGLFRQAPVLIFAPWR